ncbi:hypothetical protein BKA66DRAFT_516301 [Pyrenochaeta sp. MPI-SDFR-AT-0127]|nr:hypothetical protein BKA66DRAFT_516301 [Pyrenochaeta sp. MPI-SDFR-AT-0127]
MATATPCPSPDSRAMSRQNEEQKSHPGYQFGSNASSRNMRFPAKANITVVELLTFLPNSIQCADVIYRLISNGGTHRTLWAIMTIQRDLLIEWSASHCGILLCKTMENAGYQGWTVGSHNMYPELKKATWDEANLDVNGFRTPGQVNGKHSAPPPIPFKSLNTGVRRMPTGYDALDLTRMVQYCVQNPSQLWLYPDDFEALLNRLGGPVVRRKEHLDRAAFDRWAHIIPPLRSVPTSRLLDVNRTSEENAEQIGNKARKKPLKSGGKSWKPRRKPSIQTRGVTPVSEVRFGNRRYQKSRSRENLRVQECRREEADGDHDTMLSELYIQAVAKYIAPPDDATKLENEEVIFAFLKEGVATEDDPFTPYAFGGPRSLAPYRMLHCICQPHPADNSGWAENLRWACEQRACFGYGFRAGAWNESPEHMELIATLRKDQVWASDDLLELLERERLRGEEKET